MGKSEANTLLQRLVDEMLKKWTGRSLVDVLASERLGARKVSEIKTSEQAYELCRRIGEEAADNGDSIV